MLIALALLSLQILLAGIGLWWMLAKRLHYLGFEIASPYNFFIGAVLFFQLPIYFLVAQSAGAAEGIRAVVDGNSVIDAKKIQQKWAWLHPTMALSSMAVAGGMCSVVIRREKVQEKKHQAPIGVRDYVAERQTQHKNERPKRQTVPDDDDDEDEDEDR
jgi:hypothetical protein